jgi:hypothetical protein
MRSLLDDWIKTYLQYTSNTEPPIIFHKWCALCALSAALRRKVWFNLGRIKIYPNLYVILVGEPGEVRKTQAITFMKEITSEVTGIITSADAVTPEKLIQELENAAFEDQLPDGTMMHHNSVFIISGEFESFIGQKKENQRMLTWLTDLFDCSRSGFRYYTKGSGSNVIKAPYITLLAGTTPTSISSSFPTSAIGGGLTSRMLFVWADEKQCKVAIPEEDETVIRLQMELLADLQYKAKNSGPYDFAPNTKEWWIEWYNNFNEKDPDRICLDTAFKHWYSRKPMMILKISMLISAARNETRFIYSDVIEEAIELLEEVEVNMGRAFTAVGRSESSVDVNILLTELKQRRKISETKLIQLLWNDMSMDKFNLAMEQCMKMGKIRKIPEGRQKFYVYVEGDT